MSHGIKVSAQVALSETFIFTVQKNSVVNFPRLANPRSPIFVGGRIRGPFDRPLNHQLLGLELLRNERVMTSQIALTDSSGQFALSTAEPVWPGKVTWRLTNLTDERPYQVAQGRVTILPPEIREANVRHLVLPTFNDKLTLLLSSRFVNFKLNRNGGEVEAGATQDHSVAVAHRFGDGIALGVATRLSSHRN